MSLNNISRLLSLVLRHQPEKLGLVLEPTGWVMVDDLLQALEKHGSPISQDDLVTLVETNDKKRFAFDSTGTKIRASQGHSVQVDLQWSPIQPPTILYHGTARASLQLIQKEGLKKMQRHHVHLSKDIETAQKVGDRKGQSVILEIQTGKMAQDGYTFFQSENGVFLTDEVPAKYIKPI